MSTSEIRTALHKLIEELDAPMLEAIHAVVTAHRKEAIAGYDIDGTPRTTPELLALLDAQVEAGLRGEYTTLENLRKETDVWLSRTR